MSSEIRISCIFVLAGLAILGSMQNHPYAFPGAICCLLIAAILVWKELGCRSINMVEGKTFNDKLAATLEESLKTEQTQNGLLNQCMSLMNTQYENLERNQGKLLEAMTAIQTSQSSSSKQICGKLDELSVALGKLQSLLDTVKEEQSVKDQAEKENLEDLITTVNNVQSAITDFKTRQVSDNHNVSEKLDNLHMDLGNAQPVLENIHQEQSSGIKEMSGILIALAAALKYVQPTLDGIKAGQASNNKSVNDNLDKIHTAIVNQQENLDFLEIIDHDLQPMYKFFKCDGINIQDIQGELKKTSIHQEFIHENTDNLDVLERIKNQMDDTSDSLQKLSSIPENLDNFVKEIQIENQKAGKAQQDTLSALNRALEQSRTLTKEDTNILNKILQNAK